MYLKVLVCTLVLWGNVFSAILQEAECLDKQTIRVFEGLTFSCNEYAEISEDCEWINGVRNMISGAYHYSCYESGKVVTGFSWKQDESIFLVKCCVIDIPIKLSASKTSALPLHEIQIVGDFLCGVIRILNPRYEQFHFIYYDYNFQICESY